MTTKEVKKWLKTYLKLGRDIEYTQSEIQEWESAAEWATSRFTGMPKGGGNAGFVSALEAIEKLVSRLSGMINEKLILREEIEKSIDSLEDERYKEVLTLRYIMGMRFNRIAAAMDYEERQIYNLHGLALASLAKKKREKTLQ